MCMYAYVCMYVHIHTYILLYMCMYSYVCMYIHIPTMTLVTEVTYVNQLTSICVAIAPAYVRTYVCVSYNCHHTITKQQHGAVFVVWTSDMIFPPYCCHNTQLPYTRNPWQARNIIYISQSHASRWYKLHVGTCKWYVCTYVRNYIVTSRVFAYSFDSGPSTAHRRLCLHDGSLNGSPWLVPLCVRLWVRAPPLGSWTAFLHNVHTTTCPESRIRHP